MDRLLLTPEETAELLSVGRTRLYQLLAAEQIHSVRIGTSPRIPLAALKRFVAQLDASQSTSGE